MNIYELANKVGGEIVGGRLIATINGVKQHLSEIGSDGQAFLNAAGLALVNEPAPEVAPTVEEVASAVEEPATKTKKTKSALDTLDEVEIKI